MAAPDEKDKVHCRHCGGERWHSIKAKLDVPWEDEKAPVDGFDSWQILECDGCKTVAFRHIHWFSEDYDWDEDGSHPNVYKDQYPPAPSRKPPEWRGRIWRCESLDRESSVSKLFKDIYSALGLGAYSLAAMGVRAILDWLVTSTVGQGGDFKKQLEKLRDAGHITQERVEIIYPVFDAGSAAAHRCHSPTESDLNTMLDIMEGLFYDLKIKPMRVEREAKKAEELKSKTPQRP